TETSAISATDTALAPHGRWARGTRPAPREPVLLEVSDHVDHSRRPWRTRVPLLRHPRAGRPPAAGLSQRGMRGETLPLAALAPGNLAAHERRVRPGGEPPQQRAPLSA